MTMPLMTSDYCDGGEYDKDDDEKDDDEKDESESDNQWFWWLRLYCKEVGGRHF